MPTLDRRKRFDAEEVAHALADDTDVALTASDIGQMSDLDLFDWLETLGYEWTGSGWHNTVQEQP